MTKKDLASFLHKRMGLNLKESVRIVDKFFEIIVESLAKGDDVKLPKFGSLKIQTRKPRLGRNPSTGERIEISKRKAIVFRPSKILRAKLNNNSKSDQDE